MTTPLPMPDLSFSSPTAFGAATTSSEAKVTVNGMATDPGSIASWLLGYRTGGAAPNVAGAEAVNSTLAAKQVPAQAYILAGVGILALLLFVLVRRKRL